MTLNGIILLVFGLIYLVRPGIFRIGFWKKTDIMQRMLSPENYIKYMRVLGLVFVLLGTILLITDNVK